ncbi:hypothetical protein LTR95_015202 [Oleoguttula sp. CCFEE 5521]
MEDQQAFYESQAATMYDLFYAEEVKRSALTPALDTAPDDRLLPHLNQANLESIRALSADCPRMSRLVVLAKPFAVFNRSSKLKTRLLPKSPAC